MAFSSSITAKLDAPLDRAHVKSRSQSGSTLSYVEGWHVIAEANRIFGFGDWSSETVEARCVSERPRKIGKAQRDGFSVSYIAKVRVTVEGESGLVIREGMGSGHGIDVDLGLAHESALKEAETDARKRALMTFGNPFGLALYDKTQANVRDLIHEAADNEAQRDPGTSADNMIAQIRERVGARVDRLLNHPEFAADLMLLNPEAHARVMQAAGEQRQKVQAA